MTCESRCLGGIARSFGLVDRMVTYSLTTIFDGERKLAYNRFWRMVAERERDKCVTRLQLCCFSNLLDTPSHPCTLPLLSSIIEMSDSHAPLVASSVHSLLPKVGNAVPTSSSVAQVEPFNFQARQAFRLMLDSRKNQARERITSSERQKYMKWLRAWVKADFAYEQGRLWKLPGRVYK